MLWPGRFCVGTIRFVIRITVMDTSYVVNDRRKITVRHNRSTKRSSKKMSCPDRFEMRGNPLVSVTLATDLAFAFSLKGLLTYTINFLLLGMTFQG